MVSVDDTPLRQRSEPGTAPLLSIIVPVHRVQGYLNECLDSMLSQVGIDFEVIAVDDCSPDHSGEILDGYARRDARVRVVHLTKNVGLGEARNVGLTHATGTYVWFVDSDDWLAPGALRAIGQRLRADEPDVLIVNHARVDWQRRVTQSALSEVIGPNPLPATFRLAEQPQIINVFHVAWNKVCRREFLVESGLRFPVGLYEDVPFGYPVLVIAARISVLPAVCLFYRRRRRGAITLTSGTQHFVFFEQWERLFATMAELGDRGAEFRGVIFERAINHGLFMLDNAQRVPAKHRRRFFRELVTLYQRHLPSGGYPRPTGGLGLQHRLLASGRYRLFRTLHQLNQARKSAIKSVRKAVGLTRRTLGKARMLARAVERRVYYRLQLKRPVDQRLAVYAAYWNRGYSCSPAAIYEQARTLAPQVRGVWVVDPKRAAQMPPGVDYVVVGSHRYMRVLARAKWLINNVNYPDFVVKRPGTIHVMTHHGTPLKVMGVDQQQYPVGLKDMDLGLLLRRCDRWDFSITQNAHSTVAWERAYPCGYETLEVGYPRNDRLATATEAEVARVRAELGLHPGQRVLLYAPTHREYQSGNELMFDPIELAEALGPDTVLLVRAHYFYGASAGVQEHSRVRDVSQHGCVEDLYLAADVLITDYSSLMFDYAVLDRPIVLFAPDWDAYRRTRGVYLDLFAEAPGVVATTFDELVMAFRSEAINGDVAVKARAIFREKFCALDDGHAAERVVRRVFG